MFGSAGTTPIFGTPAMGKHMNQKEGREQKKAPVSTKSQGKIMPSHKCGKQGTASGGDVSTK